MLNDLPAYGERINALVDGATGRMDNMEKSMYRTLMPKRFQEEQQAEKEAAARGTTNKKKTPVPASVPPRFRRCACAPSRRLWSAICTST